MTITSVKIRKITEDAKMKAIVSITFDDQLAVHDIKVIAGSEKVFVAMPSRKMNDGHFVDIVHPINKELREEIEREILREYYQLTESEI